MTQQPSLIEDFKTALDFFFRRRPPLQALMWHTENRAAGESFVVPQGKIYEVFCVADGANPLILNGYNIDLGIVSGYWVPLQMTEHAFVTRWLSDGTAAPKTGFDADSIGVTSCTETATTGWILSENDVLTSVGAFVVRWRDVTHRQ